GKKDGHLEQAGHGLGPPSRWRSLECGAFAVMREQRHFVKERQILWRNGYSMLRSISSHPPCCARNGGLQGGPPTAFECTRIVDAPVANCAGSRCLAVCRTRRGRRTGFDFQV